MSVEARRAQATGAAGAVLLTLCAAQFLMALDSSVMNVSIATVADDLDTTVTGIQTAIVLYTLVMAMLMVTGGKIGSIIGRKRAFTIGLVIYCSGSLTTALSPNLGVLLFGWSLLEGIGAALDHAGDRRPRRRELLHGGAAPCLRIDRGRRGHRDRRGTPDRRARHDLRLLAVGLRRRGARRCGHLPVQPPDRRRAGREPPAPRPAGLLPLGPRDGPHDLRRPVLGRLGLGDRERGRADGVRWTVARDLVDPRRPGDDRAVHAARASPRRRRRRAARHAVALPQRADDRRARDVLLPVRGDDGAVLRDPALPVGRPRALGDRHRDQDHAALAHDAARRGGRPEVLPERLASAGGRAFARRRGLRHRPALQRDGRERERGDRDGSAHADRTRDGGPRLAAGQRHRLGGPRRREPRGRRPPEHRHAVRRLPRHGARGLGADRLAVGVVPHRDRREPGRPAAGRRSGERAS